MNLWIRCLVSAIRAKRRLALRDELTVFLGHGFELSLVERDLVLELIDPELAANDHQLSIVELLKIDHRIRICLLIDYFRPLWCLFRWHAIVDRLIKALLCAALTYKFDLGGMNPLRSTILLLHDLILVTLIVGFVGLLIVVDFLQQGLAAVTSLISHVAA